MSLHLCPCQATNPVSGLRAGVFGWLREDLAMAYSAFITDFLREAKVPRLSLKDPPPDERLIAKAAEAKDREITGEENSNVGCIRSLLFLAAGELDQAHRLAQEIPTSAGSYIHGMIHRIDDDFGNARYWFRRARTVPAAAEMYRRAAAASVTVASHPSWDPFAVSDMVEASRIDGVSDELRAVLTVEFEVLLEFLCKTTEE